MFEKIGDDFFFRQNIERYVGFAALGSPYTLPPNLNVLGPTADSARALAVLFKRLWTVNMI